MAWTLGVRAGGTSLMDPFLHLLVRQGRFRMQTFVLIKKKAFYMSLYVPNTLKCKHL